MTSFTGQILLESIAVPAIVAGLVVFPTRWLSHRVSLGLITAAAFLAAIIATYLLIFSWPVSTVLAARQKIIFLTVVAALLSLSLGRKLSSRSLLVLSILGPLWIGWPALLQGKPASLLLALPMIVGFRVTWMSCRSDRPAREHTELCLLLLLMATGLALIALFARTLSVSQLSLALASTIPSILILGPQRRACLLPTMSAVMLSGLLSTVLLYSDASIAALGILSAALAAPALAGLLGKTRLFHSHAPATLLIASLLVALAAVIAWIDAGAVSVYEGAQQDGRGIQTFVLRGDDGHDWEGS